MKMATSKNEKGEICHRASDKRHNGLNVKRKEQAL